MDSLTRDAGKSDPQEIRRTIAALFDDISIVEIRVLKAHDGRRSCGTISGYFDGQHREALAKAAEDCSGFAAAVYVTLNPINTACLARSANRHKAWARDTTTDADIDSRRWLFLDFDPKRPAGISSTDAEHDAAIAHARTVQDWLTEQGWPEPILADSGNGAHLLYRIDLPNDAESLAVVKGVLGAIAEQWSTDTITVDKSVSNAARICKLYGTLSAKGDATSDRP